MAFIMRPSAKFLDRMYIEIAICTQYLKARQKVFYMG